MTDLHALGVPPTLNPSIDRLNMTDYYATVR